MVSLYKLTIKNDEDLTKKKKQEKRRKREEWLYWTGKPEHAERPTCKGEKAQDWKHALRFVLLRCVLDDRYLDRYCSTLRRKHYAAM